MFSTLTSDALLEEQLPRIVEHRYKSFGKSAVEPLLEPFWKWGVTFVPKRVAPNTLTLSGLLANVFSTLIILYYSPNFRNEIPASSVLFFCAAVFLYQTLDALDGLHARRTNTCSPLGELFDHGCDAISMYVLSMGYFSIIGFGNSPIAMLVEFFILNCTFYASQWQSFVTGSMSFDGFSVTESLLFLMLVSIISAFFGVQLWTFKEPFFGIELNKIQFWIAVVGSTVLFVRFAHTISVDGVGKCGTTVANTSVLFPICPLLLVFGSAFFLVTRSPSHVYQSHPCLFLLCFGAVMAKISQNLVIAHMTRSGISLFDCAMIGPFSLSLNVYFDCPVNEHLLLWLACLWATADMLSFCVRVCIQVSRYLGLYVFSVDRPQKIVQGIASTGQRRSVQSSASTTPGQRLRMRRAPQQSIYSGSADKR